MDQVLDKQALMDIIDGNADLLKELIKLYMANLPKLMSQIKDGVLKQDSTVIEHSAHALKGMSYNISAQRIASAAQALEKMGRSKDMAQAEAMYAVLEKEARELETVLNELSQSAG
jgi:HPt (histidine-containing phosphotransfer) domain-containing protein